MFLKNVVEYKVAEQEDTQGYVDISKRLNNACS